MGIIKGVFTLKIDIKVLAYSHLKNFTERPRVTTNQAGTTAISFTTWDIPWPSTMVILKASLR
ncbi:MAG: hypothetical protein U5N58_14945 [Actinomycetota bacterium]|nr:hypothetical protein [Actinomycetota bacterium]